MMQHRKHGPRGFTLVELMTVLVILAMLAGILLPRFWKARDRATFTACAQNLKHVATALGVYANDNDQVFPAQMSHLTPKYLAIVPVCPEAGGADTYSAGYSKVDLPASFTVFCTGTFHVGTSGGGPNLPQFTLDGGLKP